MPIGQKELVSEFRWLFQEPVRSVTPTGVVAVLTGPWRTDVGPTHPDRAFSEETLDRALVGADLYRLSRGDAQQWPLVFVVTAGQEIACRQAAQSRDLEHDEALMLCADQASRFANTKTQVETLGQYLRYTKLQPTVVTSIYHVPRVARSLMRLGRPCLVVGVQPRRPLDLLGGVSEEMPRISEYVARGDIASYWDRGLVVPMIVASPGRPEGWLRYYR